MATSARSQGGGTKRRNLTRDARRIARRYAHRVDVPTAPRGSGEHPIALTALATRDLAKSRDFYSRLFGWKMMPLSAEVCAAVTPASQSVAIRAKNPDGFPGAVPFLFAPDVDP